MKNNWSVNRTFYWFQHFIQFKIQTEKYCKLSDPPLIVKNIDRILISQQKNQHYPLDSLQ